MILVREEVFDVLGEERDYQDKKWGGFEHDVGHEVESWITYMRVYLRRAEEAMMGVDFSKREAMNHIRRATALGVACMEYHYDSNDRAKPGEV